MGGGKAIEAAGAAWPASHESVFSVRKVNFGTSMKPWNPFGLESMSFSLRSLAIYRFKGLLPKMFKGLLPKMSKIIYSLSR